MATNSGVAGGTHMTQGTVPTPMVTYEAMAAAA